jgi:MFS transporter, PAT family, beta-lactamase induction signal transducer AmpG
MSDAEPRSKATSPWLFIPALYFLQGIPVVLITYTLPVMYKKLGVSNAELALWTSVITLPWVIKLFWAPLVDTYGTKRRWFQVMQLGVTLLLAVSALSLTGPWFLSLSLSVFFVMTFVSATHDVAVDGFYMLSLAERDQAFFVGIRSTAFRLAWWFAMGGLTIFAGLCEEAGVPVMRSWRYTLLVAAAVYGVAMLFARVVTPRPAADGPVTQGRAPFVEAARTFFNQRRSWAIVAFVLLYRFPEAMLSKLSAAFLLDKRVDGGLGLDTVDVGTVQGTVGVAALLVGGLLGGFAIARFGLRRMLWPLGILMTLPNLPYIWAAYTQPGLAAAYTITAAEQFGYGAGMTSLVVYLITVCRRSAYKTSQYAIGTALQFLGLLIAGTVSGVLQEQLGYPLFFVVLCLSAIPGLALIQLIPLHEDG